MEKRAPLRETLVQSLGDVNPTNFAEKEKKVDEYHSLKNKRKNKRRTNNLKNPLKLTLLILSQMVMYYV